MFAETSSKNYHSWYPLNMDTKNESDVASTFLGLASMCVSLSSKGKSFIWKIKHLGRASPEQSLRVWWNFSVWGQPVLLKAKPPLHLTNPQLLTEPDKYAHFRNN